MSRLYDLTSNDMKCSTYKEIIEARSCFEMQTCLFVATVFQDQFPQFQDAIRSGYRKNTQCVNVTYF